MPFEYILYIPIVILITIYFLSKAKNKAFVTLFNLWLFGNPIFENPKYVISFSVVGFDIQPNRLLFLVLTPILVLWAITPRRGLKDAIPPEPRKLRVFEIALIGLILLLVFTVGINFSSIGTGSAIAIITNSIAFLVVYFCAMKFFSAEDFRLIKAAFMAFALISAIVALYQFFINPEFFRLGDMRTGFSNFYRSNGLFSAEYYQGLFLTLSIIVAISTDFKMWVKVIFIAIVCLGGFVTMHRLSWIAILVTLGLIWILYLKSNVLINILVPLALTLLLFVAINLPWSQVIIGKFASQFVAERLFSDTLSIRFSQYDFSFLMMKKYPLGVGDYSNPAYYQQAFNNGLTFTFGGANGTKREALAYVIHNGFLSSGVKYGILGLVLFSLFTISGILDFLRESVQKGKNWYSLFLIMLVFTIFNMTNDFSYLGNELGVTLAWLLGGYMAFTHPVFSGNPDTQTVANPLLKSPSTANEN